MNIYDYDKEEMARLIEMSDHMDKLCKAISMDIEEFIEYLHSIDSIDDYETKFLLRLFKE